MLQTANLLVSFFSLFSSIVSDTLNLQSESFDGRLLALLGVRVTAKSFLLSNSLLTALSRVPLEPPKPTASTPDPAMKTASI